MTGKEEDDALDDFLWGTIILPPSPQRPQFCMVLVVRLCVLYW